MSNGRTLTCTESSPHVVSKLVPLLIRVLGNLATHFSQVGDNRAKGFVHRRSACYAMFAE